MRDARDVRVAWTMPTTGKQAKMVSPMLLKMPMHQNGENA
jgi:hypothetical protein